MTAKKVKGSNVWPDRWEVSSMSDASKTYIVARKSDATMGCSCPAWKFHKAPKQHCKHIFAILESLVQVIQRTRVFLDGDLLTLNPMGNSFPTQVQVDNIMGRSNASMVATVKGEQFKVSRVFLEE
jgi:hypothetical protein